MEKITEKEAMKLLKEFDIEEMIDINTEDYYWVKDMYPKAWELIQKLDDTIKYVNVDDMQGSDFAVGLCGTARAWALHICQWADSDGYEDDYEDAEDADDWWVIYLCPLLEYFKTEENTLDLISAIWSLDIRELQEGGENIDEDTKVTYEVCPFCDTEEQYPLNKGMIQTCPHCKKLIILCSICSHCGDNCGKCKYQDLIDEL